MEDNLKKQKELEMKVKEAEEYSHNVRASQIEFIRSGMKSAEDFYYRLAIICASAITFSVSFISYVSTTNNILSHTWFLFVSWFLLLLSLFGSLYRNHFHSNFLHYQLQKKYLESKVSVEKLVKEMLEKYPETVFNTYDGVENLINASDQRKGVYQKAKDFNENKEKIYDFLWINCMRMAHVGFVLGMLFIVIFAILNLK